MSVDYELPPSTGWPDIERLVPGEVILASDWAPIAEALAAALAVVGAGPVVSQEWEGGLAFADGGVAPPAALAWRIPRPSDRHSTLRVRIRCSVAFGETAGTLATVDGADSVAMDGIGAGIGWYQYDLEAGAVLDDSGALPVEYDTLTLTPEGNPTFYNVVVEWLPIPSPIPAGTFDGAPAVSAELLAADGALSAAIGRWLLAGARSVLRRPMLPWSWAALADVWAVPLFTPGLAQLDPTMGAVFAAPASGAVGLFGAVMRVTATGAGAGGPFHPHPDPIPAAGEWAGEAPARYPDLFGARIEGMPGTAAVAVTSLTVWHTGPGSDFPWAEE